MKIIESFLCGKENTLETCEDTLIIGKHLIAIIDGVTSKGIHLWNGKTSGYYAMSILKDYLHQNIDVEKQNAVELLRNLDHILYKKIQNNIKELSYKEYPRASIIIYNDFYKEIWSYGDCQCRINKKIHIYSKKIDELNANLRAFYLEYLISQGTDIKELEINDLGRKGIQQNLMIQFTFENKLGYFGYPTEKE